MRACLWVALLFDVSKWLVNILIRDHLVHLRTVESSPLQKQMLANVFFFCLRKASVSGGECSSGLASASLLAGLPHGDSEDQAGG